ncbi:MAG TPA: hypothetical protein VHB02_16015 [Acidimicrobiales bacterium]|nr:hypothetical protein [Acidimicrobiales bacterium]
MTGPQAATADRLIDAGLPPYRGVADPDPLVLALVASAVDQVWPRPAVPADETDPVHRVWRFSGRWWAKPTPLRRQRPWSGR